MASSPTERPLPSPAAFALQEVIACWDQAYEALARGDLERVAGLLDVAGEWLTKVGDPADDGPPEARLRHEAVGSRGRLEHGMKAGLDGLRDELARVRQGARTLQGYRDPGRGLGANFESRV